MQASLFIHAGRGQHHQFNGEKDLELLRALDTGVLRRL
jgi:hypothetical protein